MVLTCSFENSGFTYKFMNICWAQVSYTICCIRVIGFEYPWSKKLKKNEKKT